jgi:hypothetical protein
MALGAIHVLAAFLLLFPPYDAAYEHLDREAPDEETARMLHVSVVGVGLALLAAGAWLSRQSSAWAILGAAAGVPIGLAMAEMSRAYSHTECWTGFWSGGCTTDAPGLHQVHSVLLWLAVAIALAAILVRAGLGARASAAAMVGSGMAVAAAFAVASASLLTRLHGEALRAAEANKPVLHDTPGLGWAALAVALAALAMVARRRHPA